MTTEIKGMVQFPAHSLAAGWHCCWGQEGGIIFSSGLFFTSPLFVREKETSLSQKKHLWKIRKCKKPGANHLFGDRRTGQAFPWQFFFRRNIPLFQTKAVGSFHPAWLGPWHWGKRQRNGVEDGNPLAPWLLPPPPCFFLKLVLRKAGCSLQRTLKTCFISVLGANYECDLLIHFQSPKWKGSLPACRWVFAAVLSKLHSDPQRLWLCDCTVNLVATV